MLYIRATLCNNISMLDCWRWNRLIGNKFILLLDVGPTRVEWEHTGVSRKGLETDHKYN